MSECGFQKAAFSEFHSCMDKSLPERPTGTQDYYTKTNAEIREKLNYCAAQIDAKEMKEKEAYEDFSAFVDNKILEEQRSAQIAGTVVAVGLLGVAVAACANSNCGGPSNHHSYYNEPFMCSACPNCAPVCTIGKACGNSCISVGDTCHVGRGSACNTNWRNYP